MYPKILLLAFLAFAAPAAGAVFEIETYWRPEGSSEFVFLSGEQELCRFSGRSPNNESQKGTCRFEMPAGATTLSVRGRFVLPSEGSGRAKTVSGKQDFPLRDAGVFMRPLRDASLPVAERWRRAIAAEKAFAEAYDGIALMDATAPAKKAQIAEAEKRLGFALPQPYRDLVTQLGGLDLSDHSVPAPERLLRADETILEDWSYGEEGTPKWLSPAALERLRRSVILFFEVGDGVGAQLFLAPPNKACKDAFATTYFHEEQLADAMREIANDELDCTPFDEALAGLIETFILIEHETSVADGRGELLIDSSADVQQLHLRYSADANGRFSVTLSRE